MAYRARILADSISPEGVRLTTFEVEFPRFILAEVNTHRMLSRNSASSRAIPVEKAIQMVENDPFIPEQFGKNKAGMSWDDTTLDDVASESARKAWTDAMQESIFAARRLAHLEVHKALANRILEPYKWHTALITATEWSNFFALRTDTNAQPEFRKIALMMKEVYEKGQPRILHPNQWHLPLVDKHELLCSSPLPGDMTGGTHIDWNYWTKVSTGRCARISYETHDKKGRDPEKDIALHDSLKTNGHMSPFEHQATPLEPLEGGFTSKHTFVKNFRGWRQYRSYIPNESDFGLIRELEAV